jgi:hypothetical protein
MDDHQQRYADARRQPRFTKKQLDADRHRHDAAAGFHVNGFAGK